MIIKAGVVAPVAPPVTIELTGEEAKKLRRVCYYNKTVAQKFRGNEAGGPRKADDILAFMSSLGNSLKSKGIERF
jgi:hypothetical protein